MTAVITDTSKSCTDDEIEEDITNEMKERGEEAQAEGRYRRIPRRGSPVSCGGYEADQACLGV